MLTMLWRKYWMELRGLWIFALVFIELPAIYFAHQVRVHPGHGAAPMQGFLFLFAILVLGVFPPRFAGTGLATSGGVRPHQGSDHSVLFTLSLPIRRRTLFIYRATFALLALETVTVVGLLSATALLLQLGDSWQLLAEGLWILFFMLPIYFLDSLLAIRFTEAATMQIHFALVFALLFIPPLFGVHTQTVLAALSGLAPLSLALSTLLIAAGLAILVVWKLDRRDY